MQCQQSVTIWHQPEVGRGVQLFCASTVLVQGVNHHVADKKYLFWRDALSLEILVGAARGGEQKIRECVGDDAVDLLRHPAVETAQAGLDVGHRRPQFGGGDGAGQRRVDVADHDHHVRAFLQQYFFESHHHAGGLLSVGAGADAQVDVGAGDAQLVEKDLGHFVVVVLTGVE